MLAMGSPSPPAVRTVTAMTPRTRGYPKTDLTIDALYLESGLTRHQVWELAEAGLLVPTRHQDGQPIYRPKLALWGRKLAYLFGTGWTVGEIQRWQRERWTWPDPRVWPPPRPGRKRGEMVELPSDFGKT
jgi:hypothetical protein